MKLHHAAPANDTPKRPKGTGTIIRREDGRFRALYAFVAGRREEIDGSPFETREDAERALAALLLALRAAGATNQGLPLRKVAERCFDSREAGGYKSVSSERDRWSAYLEAHELGDVPARLVTRGEVRELLNGLRNRKTKRLLAVQTRRNVLNMLRAVFDYGVEAGLLEENPLVGMKVKDAGRTSEAMRPLSLAQATALLDAATDPVVAVALGTGMRSGELRALRWDHVHLEGPAPCIVSVYGAPPAVSRKNGRPLRVPLFGWALEALRAIAAATPEEDRRGIVFRSATGCYRTKGRAVEPKPWKAWLAAAGITTRGVRFHDLRHTCATLLLNGDLGRKWTYEEVKELLGHSSVKVTERYAKLLGTLADQAATEMRAASAGRIDGIQMGSTASEPAVSQAREILERRGSDSNRRMTVLQSRSTPSDPATLEQLRILAGSYVRAVAEGRPHAHTRGLDLADAVIDAVEELLAGDASAAGGAS